MFGYVTQFLSAAVNAGLVYLQQLFHTYGLAAFIVASLFRGLMLFYIIPAEAVTPTYVLLTADSQLEVVFIALIAAAFILIGNTAIYLLSRRLGETFVLYKKFRGTKQWRFMELVFDRHGRFSMFTLRLVPFINGWATIPAGIVRFPFRGFLIYSFLGFFAYELILGLAAYHGIGIIALIRFETLAPLVTFLQSVVQ